MKQDNDVGLQPAIVKYREAIDLDPRYAIAYAKLAQAYGRMYAISRDTGALHLARANCDHALALDAKSLEGHRSNAKLLDEAGDLRGALEEMKRTLALDPLNPVTLLWLARLYTRMDRWPDAERTFHRVLQERPNFWLIYNELGFGLHGQGRWKEAVEAFRAATIAAPKSAMAASNLGVEYLQIGEFDEAIKSLKQSLLLQPNSGTAMASTSLALRYQKKFEEALTFALNATALNPEDDTIWLELGDCYSSIPYREHEARVAYARAAKEAKRHINVDPANGPAWMMLSLYQIKSGSREQAMSSLARANSLGTDDMDSQLYKVRILELLGRRDDALATLKRCFERGATDLQIMPLPDMELLRADNRYRTLRADNN